MTDGEEEEGDAIAAAKRAKQKGIRIFTVGVGTKQGDLIQVPAADGQMEFLKDANGDVVKSHLNENLLEQIAYVTNGAYVRSSATEFGLDYLYDRQLAKLKKHDEEIKTARLYDEHYQWPLSLGLILLLIELFFPVSFFDKKIASSVFVLLAMTLVFSSSAYASVAGDVNKANDLYKQGDYDDSLDLYQKALEKDADSSSVKYDLGTAYYKKGDYPKALEYLRQAAQDKNLKITPLAEYNMGNALYKSAVGKEKSNVDEAIKSLQEALAHYGETIKADPQDQDASYNEDIVKKEIERLKQQKQQQQQQNQQNQNQKNQKSQAQQQAGQKQNQSQQQQGQQGQSQNQPQQQSQGQQNQPQQGQQQQQSRAQENKQNQNNQQQQAGQQGKQQNQKQQGSSQPMSQAEIDRKQAQDMLEDYQENEEPKKLLNYMPKKIDERPVLKDW